MGTAQDNKRTQSRRRTNAAGPGLRTRRRRTTSAAKMRAQLQQLPCAGRAGNTRSATLHAWCRGHGLLGRRRHPPRLLAVHGVDQGPSRRSMSAVATAAALSVCRCRFGSRWPQRGRASVGRGFAALFVGSLPPRGGFTACTRGGHAVSEGACLGCVRHTCTCATAAVMPPHGVRRARVVASVPSVARYDRCRCNRGVAWTWARQNAKQPCLPECAASRFKRLRRAKNAAPKL